MHLECECEDKGREGATIKEVFSRERGEEESSERRGGLKELGTLVLEDLGWEEGETDKEGVHHWNLDQKFMGVDWEQELRERDEKSRRASNI
jgi:hypothetical protein